MIQNIAINSHQTWVSSLSATAASFSWKYLILIRQSFKKKNLHIEGKFISNNAEKEVEDSQMFTISNLPSELLVVYLQTFSTEARSGQPPCPLCS